MDIRAVIERRRVWLLNFDADDELGGQGTSRTTASAAMRARLAELAARVSELTGDDEIAGENRVDGSTGYAWCPTPSALRALARIGAAVPPPSLPSFDVLRRANHRRFSAELGQTVPGAVFVDDAASAFGHLSSPSPTGSWVAKRAFSYAGRGRIFVRNERGTGEHESWIRASFADAATSGLQVEPWLPRLADFAQHGFVASDGDGRVTLGCPTAQMCDERGVWSGSTRTHDLSASEAAALAAEAERAGEALRTIGYRGPFGIDAFRFAASEGATGFAARIEINARYTMGWAVGMAGRRVDLAHKT